MIFTNEKPTKPGAYWVTCSDLTRPALVEVHLFEGELWCSLHQRTTFDVGQEGFGYPVADLHTTFKWAGPLVWLDEAGWPVLEKPAVVGSVRFHEGVSARPVVECAQRLYAHEETSVPVLRAMARNYQSGSSWDRLDGEAVTKAAAEIEALNERLSQAQSDANSLVAYARKLEGLLEEALSSVRADAGKCDSAQEHATLQDLERRIVAVLAEGKNYE